MEIEYEEIGKCLPFKEAAELRSKAKYIGNADDGWSSIMKVDDTYYVVQEGLQEHEGHVYMTPVKITGMMFIDNFGR